MKTIMLISAMLFMCFTGTSVVAENADSTQIEAIPKGIKKAISQQMYFPVKARESDIEGEVVICFYVTNKGRIKINSINGHPLLIKYVKIKLESVECCPPSASIVNKHMFVRYNFDIQN